MLVGYHTTERAVAESVVANGLRLDGANDEKEWLGKGVYIWLDNIGMAEIWASIGKTNGWLNNPAIVSFEVDPGNCLNVNDIANHAEIEAAFKFLSDAHKTLGTLLPTNEKIINNVPINRFLDCFVIETVDYLRRINKLARYDTVMGLFEDGNPIYPGAALKDRSHLQMAVRNHRCLANAKIV